MTLIGKQNDGEVPKGGHLIQGKDGSGNAQDVAVDTDGNLQVDIVSGAGGAQFAEDSAHASGHEGTMLLAVRNDGGGSLSGDGDYTPLTTNDVGALYVVPPEKSQVLNGSFEDGSGVFPDFWTYRQDSGDVVPTWESSGAHQGTKCIKFAPDGSDVAGRIYQTEKLPIRNSHMVNILCFSKVASTNGSEATCNFGVEALFYDDAGNLLDAVGTLYARDSTDDGTYSASTSIAIFENNVGATQVSFAFGVASMSANCEVYIDSFAGYVVPQFQATGLHGRPLGQVKDSSGSEYPVQVASGLTGQAIKNHAVMIGGSDGTNLRTVKVDSSGNQYVRLQDAAGDEISIAAFPSADNAAVQNTLATSAFPLMFDGSTWDRVRGDSTNGLLVNLGTNNDVTVTGTVDLGATDNAVLDGIASDTEAIKTAVEILDNAISGTEMQVDVLTMPTTTVQATNLDIRDIDAASDDITVHGDVGVLDQLDLTNTNPLAVAIVDGDGTQLTSFGGGTQYTEGDTDASITGTAMLMEVAADALAPVQGTVADGLLVNLGSNNDVTVSGVSTSAKQDTIIGHLDGVEGILTTIDTDTGNIATAVQLIDDAIHADDAAFTLGTSKGVMMMGFAGTQSVNANDAGAIAMETDGSVHIHDGGNTITVDGTVTANLSATDNQVLDNIDADLTTVIGHVDGIEALLGTIDTDTGNIDTSLNTIEAGYAAEGAALGSGVLIQGDDGTDRTNVLVDTDGHLQVDVLSGGVAGTEYTVDADAPDTPAGGTFVMERDDTLAALTPIEGDWVHPRSNANGALWTAVNGTVAVTQSGTWDEVGINDSGNSITVDNGGTFAVQVDGSALTALQLIDNLVLAEDAAHISGDPGIQMLGVSNESLTSWASSSTGDYTPIATDRRGIPLIMGPVNHDVVESGIVRPIVTGSVAASSEPAAVAAGDVVRAYFDTTGYQYVKLGAGTNGIGKLTANSGVDIGDVDVTSITGVTMSNAAIQTTGDEAHDDADAGNPVKIGGKAQSHLSDPAEVSAANDRVNALFDRVGRQAVYSGYPIKSAVINTSTSGDNTIVAAVATKHIRVLSVLIVSDGTTDVRWESGAGGTALTGQVPLQAREGYAISNSWGLFQTTAVNTLLNLELTAAVNVHGFITYIEVDD